MLFNKNDLFRFLNLLKKGVARLTRSYDIIDVLFPYKFRKKQMEKI